MARRKAKFASYGFLHSIINANLPIWQSTEDAFYIINHPVKPASLFMLYGPRPEQVDKRTVAQLKFIHEEILDSMDEKIWSGRVRSNTTKSGCVRTDTSTFAEFLFVINQSQLSPFSEVHLLIHDACRSAATPSRTSWQERAANSYRKSRGHGEWTWVEYIHRQKETRRW